MESFVEKLQRIGLTEYEAKAYLALMNAHLNTATNVAKESGVPRTKIYIVLESLASAREKIKEDYNQFLESIKMTLGKEVNNMKDKFVIRRFDIGLESLKEEMKKAKTIEINNTTAAFVKKVSEAFRKDAVIKVLLFPQEPTLSLNNVQVKHAEVGIVSVVRKKEVPSMSILLDESRTFTVFQDPVDHRYIVDEMLYDECSKCFSQWSNMSWGAAEEEA